MRRRQAADDPADLVPAELLTFDQQEWQREGDNGRWQPAFHRWTDARAAFMAAHPESQALGNALERLRAEFQAQFSPEHYPPSGTILTDGPSGPTQQDFQPPEWAEWAEWADSTRFSTTPRRGWGYATAEVDAFRQEIRDTFLGVSRPLLTSDEVRHKRFRMARQGYEVEQADAFFDQAEQRLAAMRPTDQGRRD